MSNEILSKDHLGQTFPSMAAMCRHWKMKFCTVWFRLEAGWSMKDALTTPPLPHTARNALGRGIGCKDHLGREFISQIEMCRTWGININTFRGRRMSGLSVEEALTKPLRKANSRQKQIK